MFPRYRWRRETPSLHFDPRRAARRHRHIRAGSLLFPSLPRSERDRTARLGKVSTSTWVMPRVIPSRRAFGVEGADLLQGGSPSITTQGLSCSSAAGAEAPAPETPSHRDRHRVRRFCHLRPAHVVRLCQLAAVALCGGLRRGMTFMRIFCKAAPHHFNMRFDSCEDCRFVADRIGQAGAAAIVRRCSSRMDAV